MELAKAYVQIVPSAEGISGSIGKVLNPEAESAGTQAGDSIGSKLVSGLKKALVGAGVTKIIGDALNAGGDLQQSFGGLDTIYGEASAQAKEYAKEAAQMGISMNDYAEQAVSFGASLKQAFGGDTTKAVEAANIAIKDMADNSAKMGTDIGSIQTAYQGFAKQNYTMLDNLKLGYGGTKTEMERLLADAQKLSGIEYNIDNLGDVYEAIHVIQEDLGLTGVAAEEASETFTGSLGAMKAAAQNVLANLTTGGDVSGSLNTLISSFQTFFWDNLIPMVKSLLGSLPDVINGLLSGVIRQINIASNGTSEFLSFAVDFITGIASALWENLPYLIEALINLGKNAIDSLINFDWSGAISNFFNNIKDLLSMQAGEIFGSDDTNIVALFIQSIQEKLPLVISSAGEIINSLLSGFLENAPSILESGAEMLINLVQGLLSALPNIVSAVGEVIVTLIKTVVSNLPQIIETGFSILAKLVVGIIQAIPKVISAIFELIKTIVVNLKDYDWGTLGRNIIEGIKNGLINAGSQIWEALKSICQEAWQGVKDFFKIGSPSKLMADSIGKWIPAGIAVGVEGNTKPLTNAMDDLANNTVSTASSILGAVNTGRVNVSTTNEERNNSMYDLMATYLPIIADKCGVEISADSRGIFKAVVRENASNTRSTGINALAY